MIKLMIVSILTLVLTFLAKSQSFEGVVIYSNNYISKIPTYPSEQFNILMGTQQAYAIKGNNYKSVFNGQFTKLQMYIGDENKSYTLTGKSDTLYWEDYGVNNSKAISYEIKEHQDTILGISCNVIIIITEDSRSEVYYNSKYSINADLFKNHNYNNWYYIISKTGALPLKTVFESAQFVMTSMATKITSMELDDNVFEVQNTNKVAKAYW